MPPSSTVRLLRPLRTFFAGLGVVLLAAWFFPETGAKGGLLQTPWTTQAAVMVIFFVQGLQLPSNEIRQGLLAWKLHLFCQSWIFLGVPLVALLVGWPLRQWIPAELQVGLLYLAFLPTTIATSAAFTAQAGGNSAAALFNICAANFFGLFLAPTWLAWLLASGEAASPDLGPMFLKIIWQLLLPFAFGQLCRVRLQDWAAARRQVLSQLNTWLIFFIIYAALCGFRLAPPSGQGAGLLLAAVGWSVALLLGVNALCALHLRALAWPLSWKSAAFFVSTQKTLAAGLPIAGAVMAGRTEGPPLAVVILPLLIYHIAQLILGAFLIPAWTRPKSDEST